MQLRAPALDDAEAVLAILSARDIADIGEPDYTLEDLLEEWRASDIALADDVRVAELDDEIAGYVIVSRPGTQVVVDPRFEGRGIGRALLEWAEARDRDRGRDRHRQWIGAGNERGRELLSAAGYELLRSYWRMVRDLDGRESPPTPPDGVRLRPLDVEADGAEVHALDDRSFSANADYTPSSLEQFAEEHLEKHDLASALSVIAEVDDAIAGFLLTRVWREQAAGFVDILAVHPDHQGRGIGSTLLRQAFASYGADGLTEAQLGVASDTPRAFELYERVGMRQKFRFDVYERAAR